MGEGNNPLVEGRKTARWAGLRDLRFKHLGWNPTACFKDLGMTVGVTEAVFMGAKVVGCASTGNTSGSLAAYAARAGLRAKVYLPAGQVSMNKLAQAIDFGAEIVHVDGSFDFALEQILREASDNLYFLNSINPFRLEGQKTVMFELLEQLGWQAPDYVIVPGGNLGNCSAFGKGLAELHAAGFYRSCRGWLLFRPRGRIRWPGCGAPERLSLNQWRHQRRKRPQFASAIRVRGRKRCALCATPTASSWT